MVITITIIKITIITIASIISNSQYCFFCSNFVTGYTILSKIKNNNIKICSKMISTDLLNYYREISNASTIRIHRTKIIKTRQFAAEKDCVTRMIAILLLKKLKTSLPAVQSLKSHLSQNN